MGQFIDFAYVKKHADFLKVLAHYDIETKGSGEEVRCCCPFHEDDNPSMSVNLEKKVFTCHAASCGEAGNILEFVRDMEGLDGLREAATELSRIAQIPLAAPKKKDAANGKARRRAGQPHDKKGRSVGKPNRAAKQKDGDDGLDAPSPSEPKELKPLGFELTLDPDHEYGQQRGLHPETIDRFGMGFCSRGTMKGRWCVPIHDAEGNLVAYSGRWPGDDFSDDEPKYKLPKGFDKGLVLFNLHRVVAEESKWVAVVEGIFDTVHLELKYGVPGVALLGSSISEAQVALLREAEITSIYVMLDGGAEKAQDKVVARLARDFLVRSVSLPEGVDPEAVDRDFILEHLPL